MVNYFLFHECDDFLEYLRMRNSKIWKNFTIEHYLFLIHCMNECRIVHTICSSSIVDTDIPKAAEISLLCLASDIGIWSRLHDGIAYSRVYISIHSAESFCESENIFMSFVCHHTTFYTSHRGERLERIGNRKTDIIFRMEGKSERQQDLLREGFDRTYHDLLLLLTYPWEDVALRFFLRYIFQFRWFSHVSWRWREFSFS